jgi:serine/threonine protein kinase
MNCKPAQKLIRRTVFRIFQTEDITTVPTWLKEFFDKAKRPKELRCGKYKTVYIFQNNYVISVEEQNDSQSELKDKSIKKLLNEIPEKYQKHFNYYDEVYYINKFIFRKLTLCPEYDLFDLLNDPKKRKLLKEQHLKDLILALEEAHKVGIVIGDLKPSNIMMCNNGSLSFIDLDSVVVMPYEVGSTVIRSEYWNILAYIENENITNEILIANDWIAISLIVIAYHHFDVFVWSFTKEYPALPGLYARKYTDDRNYQIIKNQLDPRKSKSDLDKAAQKIIREYDLESRKLPKQEFIDALIRAANIKKRTRFQIFGFKLKF